MATALATLTAAWEVQIATIGDDLSKANATYILERYVAAVAKIASLEAQNTVSYSIADRSVQRRSLADAEKLRISLETQLAQACYGSATLVDLNTVVAEP